MLTLKISNTLISLLQNKYKEVFKKSYDTITEKEFIGEYNNLKEKAIKADPKIYSIKPASIKARFDRVFKIKKGNVTINSFDFVCKFLLDKEAIRLATIFTDSDTPFYILKSKKHIEKNDNKPIKNKNQLQKSDEKTPQNEFYDYLNKDYWDEKIDENDDWLIDYYLYGNWRLLPKIVANEKLIEPIDYFAITKDGYPITIKSFDALLKSVKDKSLIKVNAKLAEGKSSFLWFIAKKYFLEFHVFFIRESRKTFAPTLPTFQDNKPLIILIDDALQHRNNLTDYYQKIQMHYNGRKLLFVIAERDTRFLFRELTYFANNFTYVYELSFKNTETNQVRIFEKVLDSLEKKDDKLISNKQKFIDLFDEKLKEEGLTLLERIRAVLKEKWANNTEEWVDWEELTKDKDQVLKDLYLVTALFYQFGIRVPLDFFGNETNQREIIKFLEKNKPIIYDSGYLQLRHEYAAKWFFENPTNKELGVNYFKNFIKIKIVNPSAVYLFRNISSAPEISSEGHFLFNLLNNESRKNILEYSIENIELNNEEIIKVRAQLFRVAHDLKMHDYATHQLEEIKKIDEENPYAIWQYGDYYKKKYRSTLINDYFNKAKTSFDKVYDTFKGTKSFIRDFFLLYTYCDRNHNTTLALDFINKEVADNPNVIEFKLYKLQALIFQNKTEESKALIDELENSLNLSVDNKILFNKSLAKYYNLTGEYNNARTICDIYCESLVDDKKHYIEFSIIKADSYFKEGKSDIAFSSYIQILSKKPDDEIHITNKVRVLINDIDIYIQPTKEEIEILSDCLDRNKENIKYYFFILEAFKRAKNQFELSAGLSKAIDLVDLMPESNYTSIRNKLLSIKGLIKYCGQGTEELKRLKKKVKDLESKISTREDIE